MRAALKVVQATRERMLDTGLALFLSRLHWHCHFIQKLETEPAIEYWNMHRGYDGLREAEYNPARLQALMEGRTGWPMVDACVAMLRETGWLNFRMRSMLVSVAAYPLWLHWRPVGEWLAREFLDCEPGIHWSQMQMQSGTTGTTGINTTRVYNPVKQAQDQVPHGRFVRHWLPALQQVPDTWLFQPWLMPPDLQQRMGLRPGVDLVDPVVDLDTATWLAKDRVNALRARREVQAVQAVQADIVRRHGFRQRRTEQVAGPRQRRVAEVASQQIGFDF